MKELEHFSIEIGLIDTINNTIVTTNKTCDEYGINNSTPMNLTTETPKTNLFKDKIGFYIELVKYNKKNIQKNKILWVLTTTPYTLKYIKDKYNENSDIYRQAVGYNIKHGTNSFILSSDFKNIIPINNEILIITDKENLNQILEEYIISLNINYGLRNAETKVKKLYRKQGGNNNDKY